MTEFWAERRRWVFGGDPSGDSLIRLLSIACVPRFYHFFDSCVCVSTNVNVCTYTCVWYLCVVPASFVAKIEGNWTSSILAWNRRWLFSRRSQRVSLYPPREPFVTRSIRRLHNGQRKGRQDNEQKKRKKEKWEIKQKPHVHLRKFRHFKCTHLFLGAYELRCLSFV